MTARERYLNARLAAWHAQRRAAGVLAVAIGAAGFVLWPFKGFAVALAFWIIAAWAWSMRPPPDKELDRFLHIKD